MAWTWEEILTDALSLSGILGEGQVVDASMLENARTRASKLLDELDGNGIALPVFSTDVEFNTVTGQTEYNLGGFFPGGTSSTVQDAGLGSKTFVMDSYLNTIKVGQVVKAVFDGGYMQGTATSVSDTDLIVNVTYVSGSGADIDAWDIQVLIYRPELILNAQIQIQTGNQPVWIPLTKLKYMDYRDYISVPQNQSQPINWAWNPGWPEGDFVVWPAPNQIWKIRTLCTLKWIDVVGNPQGNWTQNADLPSGYTNAFTNILAYRLAQWRRITDSNGDLKSKATDAMYVMSTYTMNHVPRVNTQPSSFPWNINRAGMNP